MVNPKSKAWRQLINRRIVEFGKQYGMHGIYFDNSFPYGIYRPDLGYGFKSEQNQIPEYPFLAYRELYQLLYTSIKTLNPNALIITHSSGYMGMPFLAYADAYLDGEQFRGVVEDSYSDLISLAEFRAEFTGKQWGLRSYFSS